MKRRLFPAVLALLAAAMAVPAFAQKFPQKPVTLVVPFAPGGNLDVVARTLAPALGLGNPVYAKAYESVEAMRMLDDRMLARWAAGKPVKGAADATVSTVENGAVAVVLEGGGWRQEGDEYRV